MTRRNRYQMNPHRQHAPFEVLSSFLTDNEAKAPHLDAGSGKQGATAAMAVAFEGIEDERAFLPNTAST